MHREYGKSKISQSLNTRNLFFHYIQSVQSSQLWLSDLFKDVINIVDEKCKNEYVLKDFIEKEIKCLKDEWGKKYESIEKETDKKIFSIFIDRIDQIFLNEDIRNFFCDECQTIDKYQNCFFCMAQNDLIHKFNVSTAKERQADCINCNKGCFSCSRAYIDNKLEHITTRLSSWFYVQRSIIKVASKIYHDSNNRIRIYYSVRSEAVRMFILNTKTGEHEKKFRDIMDLQYDRLMQENIFKKYIQNENGLYLFDETEKSKNADYAFVGTGTLRHPYTKINETVFENIIRHSFNRTRDIQNFGIELSKVIPD